MIEWLNWTELMYGWESWTIKKGEQQRIDTFELWSWRRLGLWTWRILLRVPWTSRRSNKSILEEISPDIHWKDWCWSWNSNTLGHLLQRTDSLEKSLVLGKIEGRRRRGRQRMRWFNGISDSMDMNLSKLWEFVMDRKAWFAAFHGVAKIRTQLNNWTDWLRFTGVGFGNWSV